MTRQELVTRYWESGNIFVWEMDSAVFAHIVIDDKKAMSLSGFEQKLSLTTAPGVTIVAVYRVVERPGLGLTSLLNALEEKYRGRKISEDNLQATLLWEGKTLDPDEWNEMVKELKKKFSWGEFWVEDALATNAKSSNSRKHQLVEEFNNAKYSQMVTDGIWWSNADVVQRRGENYWISIYDTLRQLGH